MSTYAGWATGIRTPMLTAFGKTITFRRQTAVGGSNPAINPVNGNIAVSATTAAGASTITLTAPLGNWMLQPGDSFTIAGDTTTYTVGAQVVVAAGVFANVPVTPALAVIEAAAAACSFSWVGVQLVQARVKSYRADMINGTTVTVRDWQVFMATTDVDGNPVVLPKPTDLLFVDGAQRSVIHAAPAYAGSTAIHYEVQARA